MQFSVIYSVDVLADTDVLDYAPPHVKDLWDETEDDDNYEYGYLEGEWEGGHHRKWCAILDREQFEEFVSHCGLTAESTETMGSLGAPGCGLGWAPAICFQSGDSDAIQCAYVTPFPRTKKEPLGRNDWQRVKGAVLAVYG
jgi:hypothetical protein